MVLLIKEMLSQLDEICALKKRGHKAELSMGLLRETASVLKDLPPDLIERYLELLPTLAQSDKPLEPRVSEDYVISIAPAKRRFIERVRNDLLSKVA